jgi:hypothetical protein
VSDPVSRAPRRVPRVGVVLDLAAGEWRYAQQPRAVSVRVVGVREEISRWYGGEWVWIVGELLAADGSVVETAGFLVAVVALHDDQVQD